jgi:preprotein translocase subunit SecE
VNPESNQLTEPADPVGDVAVAERPRADRAPGGHDELSVPGRVVEFGREVRSELRQVAWPTRAEVVNAALVVLVVLVLLVAAIFGLNYLFSHAVNWLYGS